MRLSRTTFVLLLLILLLISLPLTTAAQTSKAATITIEGQLVCSLCWFEADRKTTPFGNEADIACARDCADKGIPTAVAVNSGEGFKLYLIEGDEFKQHKDEWLNHLGKRVEVVGRVRHEKDKDYIAVAGLKMTATETANSQQSEIIGTQAELILTDLFGVQQKLSAYHGKIVVLNFWATWCIPCRKEMPDLAAIQNDYAALGVQVVGAAADTLADRTKVLSFVKENRINFPIWLSATTADMKRYGLGPALPGTAIIGRDGNLLWLKNGIISQAEIRKQIDNLLAANAELLKDEIASARRAPVEASLVPS